MVKQSLLIEYAKDAFLASRVGVSLPGRGRYCKTKLHPHRAWVLLGFETISLKVYLTGILLNDSDVFF